MRRILVMLRTLCMMAGAACAEAEYVSVSVLRGQAEAMGCWMQTYEAHGRTIDVDVPVIVPDVEQVPILQVKPVMGHEIIENLDLQKNEKNGAKNDYEDKAILPYLSGDDVSVEAATVSCFDPAEKDRAFFQVYNRTPISQRLGGDWTYTRAFYYPYEAAPKTIFAEENALSLADAQNALKRLLTYYCGEEFSDIEMDYIEVRGRARKQNGIREDDLGDYKKDYPKGTYYLDFQQKFAGVPLYLNMSEKMLSTGEANFTREVAFKWNRLMGVTNYEYMDDTSFSLNAILFKKEAVVEEDIPLASLDAVVNTLEQEIDAGLLRNVYALRLGYVCYLDEGSPDTFSLYPMWACDCEYAESAKQKFEVNIWSDEFRESFYYQQILIDARRARSCPAG